MEETPDAGEGPSAGMTREAKRGHGRAEGTES